MARGADWFDLEPFTLEETSCRPFRLHTLVGRLVEKARLRARLREFYGWADARGGTPPALATLTQVGGMLRAGFERGMLEAARAGHPPRRR